MIAAGLGFRAPRRRSAARNSPNRRRLLPGLGIDVHARIAKSAQQHGLEAETFEDGDPAGRRLRAVPAGQTTRGIMKQDRLTQRPGGPEMRPRPRLGCSHAPAGAPANGEASGEFRRIASTTQPRHIGRRSRRPNFSFDPAEARSGSALLSFRGATMQKRADSQRCGGSLDRRRVIVVSSLEAGRRSSRSLPRGCLRSARSWWCRRWRPRRLGGS